LNAIGKNDPRYERLKHLINVVVFSSAGERPTPHKMSGGDLDGDVYSVIWEPRLVNALDESKLWEPAVYQKFVPKKKLESDDIASHIAYYL
jgi:hypothetical protein